jgi:hypothetical protein
VNVAGAPLFDKSAGEATSVGSLFFDRSFVDKEVELSLRDCINKRLDLFIGLKAVGSSIELHYRLALSDSCLITIPPTSNSLLEPFYLTNLFCI